MSTLLRKRSPAFLRGWSTGATAVVAGKEGSASFIAGGGRGVSRDPNPPPPISDANASASAKVFLRGFAAVADKEMVGA